ncbi:MAG: type I methionyl aminopeptidase, partial [Chloroflexota bacterium]
AITVGVGELSPAIQKLLDTTQTALSRGIAQCRLGKRLGDVSAAIQEFAEAGGFSVVREYAGHGVGRELHEDPQVPNFGQWKQGLLLRRGMTLALEPMVNMGGWQTRQAENGWTVLTADGSLCAHFEHTVAITDGDAEVLTAL